MEGGALALFALSRLWIVRSADAPVMSPDEPGAWAIAKWLSGTPGAIDMLDMPRYPLGSGAVLAPLWWLPVGAELRYQLGLVLVAVVVLLAAVLVRRAVQLLGGDGWPAALSFAGVLLLPAGSFAASFTYAEPTVLLCWATLFWGVVAMCRRPTTGPLLAASLAAGIAPFVHARLSIVPLVWWGFLVWCARSRSGPHVEPDGPTAPSRRSLVVAGAITLFVALVAWRLDRAAVDALWTEPEAAIKGEPTAWITDPGAWGTFLAELAGQLWYAVIATAGLALAGIASLVEMVRRPGDRRERAVGITLGTLLASNLAASVAVMGGFLHEAGYEASGQLMPPRVDHLVYGRYNDAALLVLGALGILWCWRRRDRTVLVRLAAAAASIVMVGGIVVQRLVTAHPDLLSSFPTPNVAALSSVVLARSAPSILAFTIGGLVIAVVVLLAAARDRRSFVVVLCAWFLLGAVFGTRDAVHLQSFPTGMDVADEVGAPSGTGGVAMASDVAELSGLVGNWLPGLYQLAGDGWRTHVVDLPSAELARAPGDAEMIVLLDSEHPGQDWRAVERDRGAAVWQRMSG